MSDTALQDTALKDVDVHARIAHWNKRFLELDTPEPVPMRRAKAPQPAAGAAAPPAAAPPVAAAVTPPPQRPPALQQVIHARLMTPEELAAETERKKKRSPAFTKLAAGLDNLGGGKLVDMGIELPGANDEERGQAAKQLADKLGADVKVIAKAAAAYKRKHEAKLGDAEARLGELEAAGAEENAQLIGVLEGRCGRRRQAIRAAKDIAEGAASLEGALPELVKAVLDDPEFQAVKDTLTLRQAIEAKRRGISFADCKFAEFNDDHEDPAETRDNFAGGAVNTVAKITYADGKKGIFKPEPAEHVGNVAATGLMDLNEAAPHYGNRNIGTRAVADLIGTPVIPEARYALHKGKIGLLMDMAPGKTPGVKLFTDDKVSKEQAKQWGWSDQKAKDLHYELVGDEWVRVQHVLADPFGGNKPSDAARAGLQSQLNQMEWCDFATGQIDRHRENYLVDVKGDAAVVTGIDNDFCFGKMPNFDMHPSGYTGAGLPELIDEPTLAKILGIDFKAHLEPRLKGLLSDDEVKACETRLAKVQAHARKLQSENKVVKTWDDKTDPALIAHLQDSKSKSLFKRDLQKFC